MPVFKTVVQHSSDKEQASTDGPKENETTNGVSQVLDNLSLSSEHAHSAPTPAPTAVTGIDDLASQVQSAGAAQQKKKIIIRRAPQKEIPDLVPHQLKLQWNDSSAILPTHTHTIPASSPAASPLVLAKLAGARFLSTLDAIKHVLEVELHLLENSGTAP